MHIQVHKFAHKSLLSLTIALATFAGMTAISGCRKVAAVSAQENAAPDPADVNLAPIDSGQQPAATPQQIQNESQQRADEYSRTGAQAGAPTDQNQSYDNAPDQQYDPNEDAVDAGQVALEEDASTPPPPLPVYEQPEAPAPNYIWTPGYWAFSPIGYYWVPGAWCAPPYYGALWTPGYWYFYGNRYRFHHGFWGLHIGFYGGINYGFGYTGYGYYGGYWNGDRFYYNRAVNRINVNRITYVYNRTVVVNNYNRVSYNGGRGGLQVRPRPAELVAMRAPRTPAMTTQLQLRRDASQNRQQFFNQNRGRPAIVAAPRPIAATPNIQRPQPRPQSRPAPQSRPGQPNQPQVRPNQPQIRPEQPQTRPNQPQGRPNQPQTRPEQPQTRPVQPQIRPEQPQTRPVPPQRRPEQPQVRPDQPQVRPNQPQVRPEAPLARPAQPQVRPDQPQLLPDRPQIRPERPQQRPVQPQPQRAQPERAQRPMQQRAQPQPRQSQGSRPESRPEPHHEDNRPR